MTMKKKPVWFILLFAGFILLIFLLMQPAEIKYILSQGYEIAMLMPKGIIALKERNLLFFIQAIMLLVIIPVYILTFVFSWIYRAHNSKAKYTPDWAHSTLAETLWWGIPCVFTLIIVIVTWIETHRLDPYKPIASENKPLTIQVVALQWKWLFIYPAEKIATINYIQFPKEVPIHFEITADAPMNSFWIPQLGGQIYAMPNMKTELHLIANKEGDFRGSSANISGEGFAGMHFIAKATSEKEYQQWIQTAKDSKSVLNFEEYEQLVHPSSDVPPATYVIKENDLFERVLMKYMPPNHEHHKNTNQDKTDNQSSVKQNDE